ncbi:MAG: hypothetical protein KF740_19415 [Ramlibacter sp.]|nr:hypothetical protein [Ramlibacter sp.]
MSRATGGALRAVADVVEEMSPDQRALFLSKLKVKMRAHREAIDAEFAADGLPNKYSPSELVRDSGLMKRLGGLYQD